MPDEEVTLTEEELLDGRITEPVEIGYIYTEEVGAAAPDFALDKLGTIEDLIESGELMTPAVKPNETVFFVYKNSTVLEGTLHSVFSEYDEQADKYYYQVLLKNDFYRLVVQYPASEYNHTWFKTQAEAEAALQAIQEAEEEEENENGNDPEQAQGT